MYLKMVQNLQVHQIYPLFVNGKGYSSYYPKQTKDDSGLDVEQILLGDEVLHMDGYGVTIIDIIENEETQVVYNLDEVDTNNNFFANDLLPIMDKKLR